MCKFSHLRVLNQDNSDKFILPGTTNLTLEANTSSMSLSSFGGLPILQNEERHLSLSSQFASCITDKRSQHLVRHSLEEIIMMRVFQICLGYEDVNDCYRTRKDPLMQLTVSQGDFDKELCSSATMCRFENMVTEEDLLAIQEIELRHVLLFYEQKKEADNILSIIQSRNRLPKGNPMAHARKSQKVGFSIF